MEQLLEPLRKRLAAERLLESDWSDIVTGLRSIGKSKGLSDKKVIEHFYGQPMGANLIEGLVASEHRRLRIREAAEKFSMERTVINFLKGNVFFSEVSRWIKKTPGKFWRTTPVPTAAMCYDLETDDFVLVYNPEFFASFIVDHGEAIGTQMIEGVFHHELYHFTLKHLTVRRRRPSIVWNLGTDEAINSLILQANGVLPPCGLVPGNPWGAPEPRVDLRKGTSKRDLTPEEDELQKGLSKLIESHPRMMASEWYFNDIMKWAQKNGHTPSDRGFKPKGSGDVFDDIFDSMDLHDLWDDVPEEEREMIQERAKQIIRGAVRKADNEHNGWGSIPADVQKTFRSYIDDRVDWDRLVQNYVGSFQRGRRHNSFKRINKRAPYIHPGTRREHLPRLAVLIDESASVSDAAIGLVFAVLGALAKKVTFTVVPFDTTVDEKNVFEWKKGSSPPLKRTRQGGTNFAVACKWINDPRNKGRFDGYMVITDGGCYDPGPSQLRRAWIIVPGEKLNFPTKELVITMDDRLQNSNNALR